MPSGILPVQAWLIAATLATGDVVIVGGEYGYEPYETLSATGEPSGFNVDLMRAIAAETGIEVRFDIGPWGPRRRGIETGEIHVLGMFVSAERAAVVDFARPHLIVHHRIFLPAGQTPVRGLEDLAGREVIVQRDAYSHEYLRDSGVRAQLVLVEDDSTGLMLLASGRHDAALLTEHRARHALRRLGIDSLTVSGPPLLPVEYALAVSRTRPGLLAIVDEGLQRVRASGEFDRIHQRWFGPPDNLGASAPVRSRAWLLALVGLLVVGALALGYRVLHLRRALRESEEVRRQLAYLERHDPLTGLLNRPAFESGLNRLLADRHRAPHTHSLICLNLDRFRLVNETLGHGSGDRVLRSVAETLTARAPASALIARLGDDEFAVLVPDASPRLVAAFADTVRERIGGIGSTTQNPSMSVGASLGVVHFDDDEGLDYVTALGRADSALVAAKEAGGNSVHVWRRDDARLAERRGQLRWIGEIEEALAEGRMRAWWQPILPADPARAGPVSCEFLARMQTRDGEIVPAGAFMPAAERYGLSTRIDDWMLDHVLSWMSANPETLAALARCNINLSGHSLGDRRFLDRLERRVRACDPQVVRKLRIEITETALIANLDGARPVLERLVALGCTFALDDFGMGLSSMNYLKQLPVVSLKIDGSFVRGIESDREALAIVREINRLGHAMGKSTTAECVETAGMRQLLLEIGVDEVQGYGIGRPVPMEQLGPWCSARLDSRLAAAEA